MITFEDYLSSPIIDEMTKFDLKKFARKIGSAESEKDKANMLKQYKKVIDQLKPHQKRALKLIFRLKNIEFPKDLE